MGSPPPPYPEPPPYTPRLQRSERSESSERSPLLPRSRITSTRKQSRRKEKNNILPLLAIGLFLLSSSIFFTLTYVSKANQELSEKRDPIRVAVAGGGPAGVGAAWALGNVKLKGGRRVDVTVFEKKERIGGRMAIGINGKHGVGMKVDLEDVATGELVQSGSLLERRMKGFLELERGERVSKGFARKVGFWNEMGAGDDSMVRNMVAILMRPVKEMSWMKYFGLVWRYGASVWRAKRLVDSGNGKVEDLSQLVQAGEMQVLRSTSGDDMVHKLRIGDKYRDEIIQLQLRRQLGGQELKELNAFAVGRALAREDRLRQSQGGSFQSAMDQFMKKSKAQLRLNTEVTGFKRNEILKGKEAWILESKSAGQEESIFDNFDHIVLAGPWNATGVVSVDAEYEEIAYQSLWTTFILSNEKINSSYFGGKDLDDILPLWNVHSQRGILEISHIKDIFHPGSVKYLYRILSRHRLSKNIFWLFDNSELEVLEEKIEHAYPLLYPRANGIGDFELGDGLWQTGVVERLGSETSFAWWAGERVAGLVERRMRESE